MSHQSTCRPVGGRGAGKKITEKERRALRAELGSIDARLPELDLQIAELSADREEGQATLNHPIECERAALSRRKEQIVRILNNAQVVEARSDACSIGSTVLVQFSGQERPRQLKIGENGLKPETPIAHALLNARMIEGSAEREGARVGDTVQAETPGGVVGLTVLKIFGEEGPREES